MAGYTDAPEEDEPTPSGRPAGLRSGPPPQKPLVDATPAEEELVPTYRGTVRPGDFAGDAGTDELPGGDAPGGDNGTGGGEDPPETKLEPARPHESTGEPHEKKFPECGATPGLKRNTRGLLLLERTKFSLRRRTLPPEQTG